VITHVVLRAHGRVTRDLKHVLQFVAEQLKSPLGRLPWIDGDAHVPEALRCRDQLRHSVRDIELQPHIELQDDVRLFDPIEHRAKGGRQFPAHRQQAPAPVREWTHPRNRGVRCSDTQIHDDQHSPDDVSHVLSLARV